MIYPHHHPVAVVPRCLFSPSSAWFSGPPHSPRAEPLTKKRLCLALAVAWSNSLLLSSRPIRQAGEVERRQAARSEYSLGSHSGLDPNSLLFLSALPTVPPTTSSA